MLQEREFRRVGGRRLIRADFRLISATNVDLAACVQAVTFRGDLYHRLAVVTADLSDLVAALRAFLDGAEDTPVLTSSPEVSRRHPGPEEIEHLLSTARAGHPTPPAA